ncbi:YceI family protein [Phaeodactylibacter luteus]|uniref:YceI family protein n=2 Tax=Phaeodactylibacter luteus TaxID=1564516 RepID=A0A5C6RIT9_9BACT|nr:YceI family protein [Phaeodactylibacter luteus]
MGVLLLCASHSTGHTQERFFTRAGTVAFDAEGAMDDVEEIKAINRQALCVLDLGSGQMEWAVLMKGFQFKNALMQEHFNENYVESSLYPKAHFKGKVLNLPERKALEKGGEWPVTVKGVMALHGVSKEVVAKGLLRSRAQGQQIGLESDIELALADYGIRIPSVVGSKVAEVVAIAIQGDLDPFKK